MLSRKRWADAYLENTVSACTLWDQKRNSWEFDPAEWRACKTHRAGDPIQPETGNNIVNYHFLFVKNEEYYTIPNHKDNYICRIKTQSNLSKIYFFQFLFWRSQCTRRLNISDQSTVKINDFIVSSFVHFTTSELEIKVVPGRSIISKQWESDFQRHGKLDAGNFQFCLKIRDLFVYF